MADENAKALTERSARMFSARASTENLWQELADIFYPERGEFTVKRVTQEGYADHLFASDPAMMRRDLGNAISAMTRPGGRQWGNPDIDDEQLRKDSTVRSYLDYLGTVQWHYMYRPVANFVRATKEADHDTATFGNSVASLDVDVPRGQLLYRCHHLKDCAWCDDATGVVDTMFRKMRLSIRNAAQLFGTDTFSEAMKKALEKEPGKEFDYLHVMMPAADYEYVTKAKPKAKAKFVSIYVDVAQKKIVREAPSYEFRYIVQRWATMPGTPYAISPATITALPDGRMMQTLSRIIQEAGEKSVDPPMKGMQDAVIGDINLYAGGMTWVDREYDERLGPALEPIMMGKDAGLGLHLFDRLKGGLVDAFYLSKLQLPTQQGKTAYETAQLVEENLRASAPLFEPMEANNALILDQTFEALMRVGAFGPPESIPEKLRGKNIQFSFSNPLHDAIERAKVLQFQGLTDLTLRAMQFDQGVVANVDMNTAYRDAVMGSGTPAAWLKSEEQAQDAADAMAQQQQAAQLLQAAQAGGDAAQSIGKGAMAIQGKRAA